MIAGMKRIQTMIIVALISEIIAKMTTYHKEQNNIQTASKRIIQVNENCFKYNKTIWRWVGCIVKKMLKKATYHFKNFISKITFKPNIPFIILGFTSSDSS